MTILPLFSKRRVAPSYQYDNVAKAKTFGAELSLAYRIAETGFEPYTVLTWMRRQYDNGTGFKTYDTATPELMARYGMRDGRA